MTFAVWHHASMPCSAPPWGTAAPRPPMGTHTQGGILPAFWPPPAFCWGVAMTSGQHKRHSSLPKASGSAGSAALHSVSEVPTNQGVRSGNGGALQRGDGGPEGPRRPCGGVLQRDVTALQHQRGCLEPHGRATPCRGSHGIPWRPSHPPPDPLWPPPNPLGPPQDPSRSHWDLLHSGCCWATSTDRFPTHCTPQPQKHHNA